MKAHKRIIIWTFWLSIIFAISTIVFYILQQQENPHKIYQWLDDISLSFTAGLLVPCIIEVGNYTSTKNSLYEKLFSECSSLNGILNREMAEMQIIMDKIDNGCGIEEIEIYMNAWNILNNDYLKKCEDFTKQTDFTFITSTDKKVRCKRSESIFNTVNCLNKLSNIVVQHHIITKHILNKDTNSVYIECFNMFQSVISIKSELNKCVWQMERFYRFSMDWNKSLLIYYAQTEDERVNNCLNIYRIRANNRYQMNQAFSFVKETFTEFPHRKDNVLSKEINNKKTKVKRKSKTKPKSKDKN